MVLLKVWPLDHEHDQWFFCVNQNCLEGLLNTDGWAPTPVPNVVGPGQGIRIRNSKKFPIVAEQKSVDTSKLP